jgi:3-oxoacyl-[acyl-carrier-protein] synthase II
MAASSRRAVLTGIGVISSIGSSPAAFWGSLVGGRSGIRRIRTIDTSTLPLQIGGEIPDFDAKKYVKKEDRKALKLMARAIQMAVSAAEQALGDCRIDKANLDPTRFGVEFASGMIPTELEDLGDASLASTNCAPDHVDLERWGVHSLPTIQPTWMLKYLPNMLGCHVSILHNAQGPNNTITANDVAGLLALGEAYRIIGRDHADFFLVGGAESKLHPLSLVRLVIYGTMSNRNDEPEKACRPFDRHRDGLVFGEGGTVLVLEEREHALRRGARIYAEVVGFGSGFDRDHSGAGLARAIRAALADAGVGPEEIDHINAQGFSSVTIDAWEAQGIRQVFGDLPTPVFAAKSYFGNLGAGSATTELAASLLAFQHGQVPATLNFEEPDPACPLQVIAGRPRPVSRPYLLKISFTAMGQCAALVCRRPD